LSSAQILGAPCLKGQLQILAQFVKGGIETPEVPRPSVYDMFSFRKSIVILICDGVLLFTGTLSLPQDNKPSDLPNKEMDQLKVNWLYGSYVPKDVPLVSLDKDMRFKLYLRQTYITWEAYVKPTCFAIHDQIHGTYPEWGDGFEGFAKRWGTRVGENAITNSTIALGDGLLGWEPRYDRCRCGGFWPRTRHAFLRNFVTYNRTEKSLRPQLMPYAGAAAGAVTATTWVPSKVDVGVKAYQAAITQVPLGMGINWVAEFGPDITRVLRRSKTKGDSR
jgi:hypothetical protein